MKIKFVKLDFVIKALDPFVLPPYKGATLRGGFGVAFRRVVCVAGKKDCIGCLLRSKCVYSYVFETPPGLDTEIMRKYEAAPHPFVIEPPFEQKRIYRPGEELLFGLVLIGKAIDYLPYFIYTFNELGKTGIGKGRGRFELTAVVMDGKTVYDSTGETLSHVNTMEVSINGEENPHQNAGQLKLSFLTPTRIIYNGRLSLDLEFHMFMRNLLRRLSLIYYFHSNGAPSIFDFKGLIEKAGEVRVVRRDLQWYDWERYSGRQERKISMGGFVGEIVFEGNLSLFMPFVMAGEILHVGKGTGFGLGRYEVEQSEVGSQKQTVKC